jgi:hypothetical protein
MPRARTGALPVEVSFSLLHRTVLTPNGSKDLQGLEFIISMYWYLTKFQPKAFDWTFTRYDPLDLLQRVARREATARTSAPVTGP